MQDTCNPNNCKIYKKLKLKNSSECYNFIESWWEPEGIPKKAPKLIKDCTPRRMFLMIQDLSNRLIGVQKSQEELRNETIWMQVIAEAIGKSKRIDIEKYLEKEKFIEIQSGE